MPLGTPLSLTAKLRRLLRTHRKLRVVYVAESLEISGGVKVIVEHANALAGLGHNVSIVTKSACHSWIDVKVRVEQVPRFEAATLPAADVHIATWFPTVTPTVLAARAPRIFHFSQGYEGTLPHLADRRDEIEEAYLQPIPKLLVSRHLLDLYRGRNPGPYYVLPQTVDVDFYRSSALRSAPRSPAVVGVVGPYESPTKGVPMAVEAVARLRAAGFPVVLHRASPFPLTDEETSVCPAEVYAFRATTPEMRIWYRGLDVLVHPPFEAEGFPLPPLEAMASGVPVIVTGIRSFEPLGENEVLRAAPGDVEGIRGAIQRLLESPEAWNMLREAGLRAVTRFRPEHARDALDEVLQGRSTPEG